MALGLALPEGLRRRRPTFTADQRAALVDELLLERYTPPVPTLSECHRLWREASLERDRLRSMVSSEETAIADLERRRDDQARKRPQMAASIRAQHVPWIEQRQRHIAEVQALLAELDANVDWPALEAGEKRYQQAAAAALKAHNAARVANVRDIVDRARAAHTAARAKITADLGRDQLAAAIGKAGEAEVALILAERGLAAVEQDVKRR